MKRALLLCLLLLSACNGFIDSGTNPPPPPGAPTLFRVGNFSEPTYLTAAPGDSQRLFVVERQGTIRVLHHDTAQARPFLDLRGQVQAGYVEQGLLSMAFDPQYATNGRFFVYFTNTNGDIRIVRYHVSSDRDSADEATADTILRVAHPGQSNHNGGQLQFGPDNMLWLGTGDGGGGGDPDGNGQDKHALLGKLLRLDVSGASGYTIASNNPFATDTSGAREVWSYGLRNPWRFSFDRQTGDLYIGDVGQNRYEEVDVSSTSAQRGRGVNFGWNIMEGLHCYPSDPCTTVGQLPVVEYPHFGNACSITGGYVYRGSVLPALVGNYFYADYCDGTVHSIKYPSNTNPGDWSGLLSPGGSISAFGQDARGELYILQLTGAVWRIVPAP